ncbi:MAG TPA: TonB-dependent receptor [Chitinophagaceae bacterium]|nr:TonB-dependent receptor [Chitinophagaceae bacterium]
MKKAFLVFILFGIISASAQEKEKDANAKITGKVIDSLTNLPLEYATISLFKQGEKKAINGSTTDQDGNFMVTDVSTGVYTALAEFIGYMPFTINNIHIDQKHAVVDLRNILLAKKMLSLQNVTVATTGKLIDNKIDKLVFNAEKDITSQTGVATDVLKKVPQVSVDVDGNVELAGSSSIRFLINGKPSTAFGSSISDVLQSIPASEIKSIEVITNPGAKYDAQGLGGIINIILKKSTAQGMNGSLSLTAGTRNENGSINLNARKGKSGVNAFFSGNARPAAKTSSSSQRVSPDTALTLVNFQQDGINKFRRHGYQTGLGFDWTVKEKNNFSGSLSFENFGNNGNGIINQSQIISEEANPLHILSAINTINNTENDFSEHHANAGINYKRTFIKEDQELEINVSTSIGRNHISAGNTQLLLPQDSLFYGTSSANSGKEKETEIAVDYTQPVSKDIKLGIGGKLNFYDVKSTSNVMKFQPMYNKYLFDPSLSNYLDYNQKVYAVYAELNFPVADLTDAKIGGRYERTEINSFYSNANQHVNAPGYNTLVPSIFFLRKLTDKQTLKLSYSKRIERPDYGDLNPYINTSDPKNIAAGNPYLKPEIGNRYELSYNRDLGKTGSFMVTLFYRENHNDIQPFIVYYPSLKIGDSTYTNVSVTTRENIGLENNMGTNLFGDLHFTSKFNVRSNLFLFYRHTINAIDKGFNSHSFNYRFNMNATYQFSNTLVAEFFGNFNSPRHEAQGRYPSFTSYSMAIRKQFWNKKGSLAITAINPLNKYVSQETNLFGPNFNVVSIRKIPFRSIGINFTWKFGRLTFKKEEEGNKDNGNLNPPSEN